MRKWLVLHPFLFAVYPVLFLFTQNAGDMPAGDLVLPIALLLCLTGIMLGLMKMLFKHPEKISLIISCTIVALFSYGHLMNLGKKMGMQYDQYAASSNYILSAGLLVCLLAAGWLTLRAKSNFRRATEIWNLVAGVLVVFQVVLVSYVLVTRTGETSLRSPVSSTANMPSYRPDIYYIVVDGYARQDILKQVFDYDNSAFLNHLRERGFYVADSSHSNYGRTLQSLATSLNIDYLERLYQFGDNARNRVRLADFIQTGSVFRGLKMWGYQSVSFVSGYDVTTLRNSDAVLAPGYGLSEFQNLILGTTPIPFIFNSVASPHNLHRRRVMYTLGKIAAIEEVPSPRVVFAHIVAPHPPFLFDSAGEDSREPTSFSFSDGNHYFENGGDPETYVNGYRNQIIKVTGLLQKTIDDLLDKYGDEPPIIIVQGDHGSGLHLNWEASQKTWHRERFSILNAYYFPKLGHEKLYPEMSPVNTFRFIFRNYFGVNIDLLPDRSYYSTWDNPFSYEDVTDLLNDELPTELRKEKAGD